ncbi:MAG: hypothetical protein AAF489_02025 [Bacteroidota bacterium]
MKNFSISKIITFGVALTTMVLFQSGDILSQNKSSKNSSISINRNSNNGKSTIHVKENGKDFKIEYEGEFTLSNDDKDITAITQGGFIEITKSSFGNRRRILIESDRNGTLIRKFYVGSSEKSYLPEGKAWLAEILPEVVRSSGIAAKSRVARFYSSGGANGVLREIQKLESDYVKSIYFRLLLENNLNNSELISVIRASGKEIESDHYLAEILKSNQKAFLANRETINAYIEASASLESDHYVTNVLKKVISDSSITDSQMESLLDISKKIESDHYVTQVLIELMERRTLNSGNISKIIRLSKDIESDHYKTEVLKKVIRDEEIPANAYNSIMETMEDIESDHYISEVVKELMNGRMKVSSGGLTSLVSLVNNNVESDHYASNIYKWIAKEDLSEDQIITALNSAKSINSGHYLSEVLIAFSGKVKRSSERVKSAYRTAAKSIKSDSYYGRAVKAID